MGGVFFVARSLSSGAKNWDPKLDPPPKMRGKRYSDT